MSAAVMRGTRTRRGFTRIRCNADGCPSHLDGDNAVMTRRALRQMGWLVGLPRGYDYCPEHAA